MKEKMSIVIGTCDAYSDVATLYVQFLRKYWPECDCPIYVATEHQTIDLPDVVTVKNENGEEWVERVINAVKRAKTKYIWLTVDDLFLSSKVDNKRFEEIIQFMEEESILYYGFPLSVFTRHKNWKFTDKHDFVLYIPQNYPYGVNMGTAIWEKNELIRVFSDGIKTAWDVENYFLKKSSDAPKEKYEKYVNDNGTSLPFSHLIKKGKWIKKGVKEISNSGIEIDYSKRGFVPFSSHARTFFVGTANRFCPIKWRRGIKKFLMKLGFKFATEY